MQNISPNNRELLKLEQMKDFFRNQAKVNQEKVLGREKLMKRQLDLATQGRKFIIKKKP